jgi:uncharacterized protein YecT (DUF1311 family)
MQRKLLSLFSASLLATVAFVTIAEEEAKLFLEVEDFPKLDSFESVEAFEAHIGRYEKQCRDAWITSSLGHKCGVEAALWDRELNLAYKALIGALSAEAKEKLRSSQRSWISNRDETLVFDKVVLGLHYDDGQRMWAPIASLDHTKTLAEMTKARALQLHTWLNRVENPVSELSQSRSSPRAASRGVVRCPG